MSMKLWLALAGVVSLLVNSPAFAHCDSLDGPVVVAARKAIQTGDPSPALIWVKPSDEPTIRAAFEETLTVRKQGEPARELADRYFFETLVRIHRAGEGAAYTGLKPAGKHRESAVALADKAIASSSIDELNTALTAEVTQSLQNRFATLQRKRNFNPSDLQAGREYVESYVSFIHFAEGVYKAATAKAEGHYPEAEHTEHH